MASGGPASTPSTSCTCARLICGRWNSSAPGAMLKKLLRKAAPVLISSEHMDAADGERMFRHACALGLEGVVSKRLDRPYNSGRCHHWRKVKNPSYARP